MNTRTQKTVASYLPCLSALALPLLPISLLAQTPATSSSSSETIEMSPFTVSSDAVRGYAASETMTGSRVKTEIVDLPYTVNVLTSEFFEDFGIFEFSDNITQIGSFTGLDIGGNFNLRGFSSSYQLRDGFFRLGRYGASNIDRMEIIKGSNAAIYGRTSPGGMINMVSKAPKDTPSQKVSCNFGDYGTQRVTLEATGPLLQGALGKTRYLLTASHYQRDFDQDYAVNRNQEYYLAFDHVFKDGSKLFLSGEYFSQIRHAPLAVVPLVIDQKGTTTTTDDVAVGYALNLGKYNAYGPNSELNRSNKSLSAIYDKQLSSVFNARVSTYYYMARRWDYNQNTGWGTINLHPATAPTSIKTSRGASPNRRRRFKGQLLEQQMAPDGRSLLRGVAYLYPFLKDKTRWPLKPDVLHWDEWPVRQSALLFGALSGGSPDWLELWKHLPSDPAGEEVQRNYPIRFPTLWHP